MTSETMGLIAVAALGVVNTLLLHRNQKAIQEVHLTMNSRLDQLVKSKEETARSEGHAAGMEAQKANDKP